MAATAFFGHFFLGIGPGIAFFLAVIAPKSFVVLLSFFSAFYWLLVLLLTSAVFRGFVPLPSTQPAYAGALLAAVAIEEAARAGVWQMHKRALSVLQGMSASSGHSFTKLDELYLALGWGYGHAAVHVLFIFGSLLPLTAGHGTAYSTDCPQMSVFTVAALNSLGLGASLVALSVVALEAWGRKSWLGAAYAPLMHAGAALLTLGSFRPGGCTAAVAAQLALGLVNTWYAASIAWKQGGSSSSSTGGGSTARHSHSSGGSAGAQPLGALPADGSSGSWMAAAAADGGGSSGGGAGREASAAIVSPRAGPPPSLRSRGA